MRPARQRAAGRLILVPLLDILQSVPILGFISLHRGVLHVACPRAACSARSWPAIFAIFTSQAWNMAFSFYQSLRTVPRGPDGGLPQFRLSAWAALLAARGAVRHAAA